MRKTKETKTSQGLRVKKIDKLLSAFVRGVMNF
jgi:hypothetical protein